MAKQIVVISGSVSVGKSTLADKLRQRFGAKVLKTKNVISDLAAARLGRELDRERRAMQHFGERLDRDTKGEWVRDALRKLLADIPEDSLVIVDAVRITEQINAIREAYGPIVKHVHLTAPEEELARRYAERGDSEFKELPSIDQVQRNKTERRVARLRDAADIVIDTSLCTKDDVCVRVASHLALFARDYGRLVDVIVGGQWGSEGKGHITSYISREYSVLVRVGGPNAGHKVYAKPEPVTHHQLPSGTLRSNAKLILAPGSVLNAEKLIDEMKKLNVDSERLSIDPQAMIISTADIKREKQLVERIGSTGQGVGYATARRVTDRDKSIKLAKDVKDLRQFIKPAWEILERAYTCGDRVLVEGTQGAGLSLFHGSYPHVTSRDTSVAGCLSEAGISPSRVRKVMMVCRSYPIRVQDGSKGTSGPMGREISWQVVSGRSGLPLEQFVTKEKTSTTKKDRRVAEFSWELLRRASALNGPTDIALTFADYIDSANETARRFDQLTQPTIMFIEEVERVAAAPVSLISTRFGFRGIIDRRAW